MTSRPVTSSARRLRLDLTVGREGLRLSVGGVLDGTSAWRLGRALGLLEHSPRPSTVDLAGITAADDAGLAPLVDLARRRSGPHAHPPVVVTGLSEAVREVLEVEADVAVPRDIADLCGEPCEAAATG